MKVWSDEELVDLLRGAYGDVEAPPPSAELRACFDSGALPDPGRVVPLAGRRRRVRAVALIAAATLVTFGTLAGAGALPGPVQRGVASLARDVGLELPSPGADSHSEAPDGAPAHPGPAPLPTTTVPSAAPVGPTSSTIPGGTLVPTPTAPTLPVTPTVTLPGNGLPIGVPVPTTLPSPLPRVRSGDPLRAR